MWLAKNQYSKLELRFFSSLGKALCLSQNFEANCKNIMMWLRLTKSLQAKEISLSESDKLKGFTDKLMDLMLGPSINVLRHEFNLQEKDVRILIKAKDSRNWIAHESAKVLINQPDNSEVLKKELQILYNNVENVAEGDNIVSTWNYEFQEREPAPFLITNAYVNEVIMWIFSEFSTSDYQLLIDV